MKENPKSPNEAIVQFAAENRLDVSSIEGFEKAENGAIKRWPQLFGLSLVTNLSTEEPKPQKRLPNVEEIEAAARRHNFSIVTPEDFEKAERLAYDYVNFVVDETKGKQSPARVSLATESRALVGNGHVSINLFGGE